MVAIFEKNSKKIHKGLPLPFYKRNYVLFLLGLIQYYQLVNFNNCTLVKINC